MCFFFFFNDTATTEIYTLSLHDALPICRCSAASTTRWASSRRRPPCSRTTRRCTSSWSTSDRKSTRLNSSHGYISYAVFCLKKKKHLPTACNTHPSAPVDDDDLELL